MNSLRVVKDVKFYYISSLMEPVVFKKTSQVDRPECLIRVADYDLIVPHFDSGATVGTGAKLPCTYTYHSLTKQIYRLTKRPLFYCIFKFYIWAFYIVFWILPLCCVLNYPKRSGPCKVTVGREAKIYISFMVGNSVFFEDGIDNILLPDFQRAIKNVPSPLSTIYRLFASNKSATFH